MSTNESAMTPPKKPRRHNWKSLVIGLVLFASGLVIGSGMTVRFLWVRIIDNIHNTGQLHERLIHRVHKRLHLTSEQIEQVRGILQEHQDRFIEIREEVSPKIINELQTLRDDIDAILTPEQSEEWHRWLETMQQTWLKPFTTLHPMHPTPPHEKN